MKDTLGCSQCEELSMIQSWATSAATAKAAWIAAQIQAKSSGAWPETIRGLLVHSAEWTEPMKKQFLHGKNKRDFRGLLRTCGYGVPNLEWALWSMQNSVNFVIQAELQPYDFEKRATVCDERNALI